MERVCKNRNNGYTFVEVIISLVMIMIIGIGVASYMYACAWNARAADIRITSTRVGQLLLETWKLTGHYYLDEFGNQKWSWNVTDFNPTDFNSSLPYNFGVSVVDPGGSGTPLGRYEAVIDGKTYFVNLLYRNADPYMLTARVAWSRATGSDNLQWVDVTSYAIY